MKTIKEQIQESDRFYAILLNQPRDGMSKCRYQIYRVFEGRLEVLWPGDSDKGKSSKELLPHMVYSKQRQYPAFHWALGGCGYSKLHEMREILQHINPNATLEALSGWMPSSGF